jgi:hypothetical protein
MDKSKIIILEKLKKQNDVLNVGKTSLQNTIFLLEIAI